MDDDGPSNVEVGHRRWLLYPPLAVVGTGDARGVNRANNFMVVGPGSTASGRSSPAYVTYPADGYFPNVLTPRSRRWSVSTTNVDWSGVTVAINSVSARILHIDSDGFGLGVLVFEGPDIDWQGIDQRFTVQLFRRNAEFYSYTVIYFDALADGLPVCSVGTSVRLPSCNVNCELAGTYTLMPTYINGRVAYSRLFRGVTVYLFFLEEGWCVASTPGGMTCLNFVDDAAARPQDITAMWQNPYMFTWTGCSAAPTTVPPTRAPTAFGEQSNSGNVKSREVDSKFWLILVLLSFAGISFSSCALFVRHRRKAKRLALNLAHAQNEEPRMRQQRNQAGVSRTVHQVLVDHPTRASSDRLARPLVELQRDTDQLQEATNTFGVTSQTVHAHDAAEAAKLFGTVRFHELTRLPMARQSRGSNIDKRSSVEDKNHEQRPSLPKLGSTTEVCRRSAQVLSQVSISRGHELSIESMVFEHGHTKESEV